MEKLKFTLCNKDFKKLAPIWKTLDSFPLNNDGKKGGVICDINRDTHELMVHVFPSEKYKGIKGAVRKAVREMEKEVKQ